MSIRKLSFGKLKLKMLGNDKWKPYVKHIIGLIIPQKHPTYWQFWSGEKNIDNILLSDWTGYVNPKGRKLSAPIRYYDYVSTVIFFHHRHRGHRVFLFCPSGDDDGQRSLSVGWKCQTCHKSSLLFQILLLDFLIILEYCNRSQAYIHLNFTNWHEAWKYFCYEFRNTGFIDQ